ncbi:MAG TPA: AAA family ATPase [Steroidobacteraceae bacterium]|nr:AAA family ATPase [Steroidobacteraceae bacterium]
MAPPSVTPDPRRELEMLLASRFALIVIESREEARVLQLVREAGMKAGRGRGWGIFQWTVTEGLRRVDMDFGAAQKTLADPAQLLRHLKATPTAGIYVLLDFHPYLSDPIHVRMIKDIAQGYGEVPRTIVLMSHEVVVPQELEHLTARLKLGAPTRNERLAVVTRVAQEWAQANAGRAAPIDPQALDHLVDNLAGLETPDTERLARQAIVNDGALTMADLPGVLAAKYELLNRGGTLSYEPDTAKFADIGGLARLRQWLTSRKPAFDGSAPELDPPKGVMLIGVQGCGKSLAARAAAGIFGVPLLRLDFGSLYSKWHGESEKNLRDSLRAAEGLAPCVLWVDEMEKALAAGDGDSGVSRRVLGTFLTWLAEQRARLFVVATANDIQALPPELVRKGRFDEIFFVDLPNRAARAAILAIHARKRGVKLTPEELGALAAHSEGFSGAELEQGIVAALYTAHSTKQPMCAALILHELRATQPLSVVMAEQINGLRAWARDRTVPAN